jgi:hypothetical protein
MFSTPLDDVQSTPVNFLDTMDPSACRVIYIDDRFNTERWISREGLSKPTSPQQPSQADFGELPMDLQANVNAFLSVFNQGEHLWRTLTRAICANLTMIQSSFAIRVDPSLQNSQNSMIPSQ